MANKPWSRRVPVAPSAFERHAGAITVLMNAMFVRHLIGTYRAFDGDVVAAIVLGEVAHHNLSHLINRSRTPNELSEALRGIETERHEQLLPTNAFSIAQATGIPRESVRRKIAGLLRRGWLEKDEAGNLFVSGSPIRMFAEFNFERMNDLLDVSGAINRLLQEGPAVPAGPRLKKKAG